ncbi:MAG: hypothetical protein ACR2PR_06320 [Pseudohongiellaceae bacterium]
MKNLLFITMILALTGCLFGGGGGGGGSNAVVSTNLCTANDNIEIEGLYEFTFKDGMDVDVDGDLLMTEDCRLVIRTDAFDDGNALFAEALVFADVTLMLTGNMLTWTAEGTGYTDDDDNGIYNKPFKFSEGGAFVVPANQDDIPRVTLGDISDAELIKKVIDDPVLLTDIDGIDSWLTSIQGMTLRLNFDGTTGDMTTNTTPMCDLNGFFTPRVDPANVFDTTINLTDCNAATGVGLGLVYWTDVLGIAATQDVALGIAGIITFVPVLELAPAPQDGA